MLQVSLQHPGLYHGRINLFLNHQAAGADGIIAYGSEQIGTGS
jgi:hypothetical protein